MARGRLAICEHCNGENNENVREYVWIIAFMKQSMVLRPQRDGTKEYCSYDTQKMIACWQKQVCALLFSSVITNFAINIEIYWIYRLEEFWPRCAWICNRTNVCTSAECSAAQNAFLFCQMEFRFMDFDLKHLSFTTRFISLYFFGAKEINSATLWRTHCVSCMKFFPS